MTKAEVHAILLINVLIWYWSVNITRAVVESGNLAPALGSPFLYLFLQLSSWFFHRCQIQSSQNPIIPYTWRISTSGIDVWSNLLSLNSRKLIQTLNHSSCDCLFSSCCAAWRAPPRKQQSSWLHSHLITLNSRSIRHRSNGKKSKFLKENGSWHPIGD